MLCWYTATKYDKFLAKTRQWERQKAILPIRINHLVFLRDYREMQKVYLFNITVHETHYRVTRLPLM